MLDAPRAPLGFRRSSGAVLALLGGGLALGGMLVNAAPGSLAAFGGLISVVAGLAAASVGLLCAIGSFAPRPGDAVRCRTEGRALVPGVLLALASAALFTGLVHAAARGVVPAQAWLLAVAVPVNFLLVVLGVGHVAARLGAFGPPEAATWRLLLRQPGLWLVALTAALYLPALGNFSLLDPWEPQYAEVARGMLSRRDWISLWWGDEGWFWSKPILDFMLMAASFSWFGVDYRPEGMLGAFADGRSPAPEWAVRLPIFALSLVGVYVLYKGATKAFGGRAAWLGALILVTTPYWFFLSRQSMTDMPYMAPLAAGLGFLLLALQAAPDARVASVEITFGRRMLAVSGFHLLFSAILGLSLVQIVYLVSRHVSLDFGSSPALSLHRDQVWTGSPGNCGLPGNAACELDAAAMSTPFQPGLMALVWSVALLSLLLLERKERRARCLYFLATWSCVALACMGKAAPGIVLPLCTLAAVLVVTGRARELIRCEWGGLALILAAIAAPWFVQEYLRHGAPFLDRLFIHDMYNRAFGHVHDTNVGQDTSFRYYVWQLGYGLFPWSGVLAAGALWCIGQSTSRSTEPGARAFRDGTCLLVTWLLATFGLFSLAGTKFHHYIAPLVPAAAMLGGAWLDEWWQKRREEPLTSCLGLAAALLVALVARDLAAPVEPGMPGPARLLHLFIYKYDRPWPTGLQFEPVLVIIGLAAASCCLATLLPAWRRAAVLALCATGVACCAWCADVYLLAVARHWGQRENIAEYYRARRGPEQLLVAYSQNWMGENFYTGNHVATFKAPRQSFKAWIAEQRAAGTGVLFFTTEHGSVSRLQGELGEIQAFELLTSPESNNKFVLARVTL